MQNDRVGNGLFQIAKGVALALSLALLGAVVFASVMTATNLPNTVIYPVNQTLKVLCICIGALVFVREEKGLIKGITIALLFTALSYLTFSAVGGDFSLSWLILAEIGLAVVAGGVSGALAVNYGRV